MCLRPKATGKAQLSPNVPSSENQGKSSADNADKREKILGIKLC